MRKVSAMIVIALLCFSMLSIFAPQVKAEPSETPLEVAEKAANWVISEAIVEGDGYKWPYITWGGKLFYTSFVASGAAGVGEFMLSLYEKTGKTVYMDYAIGAANYVVAHAESDAGGYRWGHPDDELSNWYLVPGISSVGIFLLRMYQATGDSTYLEYAAGAGRWFMAYAIWEGAECYIIRNPPQQAAHEYKTGGTEEACKLLVRLYSVTGDADYLTYVEGFANWLMSDAQSVGGGYRWVYGRPWAPSYNLVNDCFMATLFYDLYQEFGDAVYLQYANGAIEWVLSQAVAVDGKYKWPYTPGETEYPLTFQSDEGLIELDLVTFGDALLMAYSVTSNPTLLEYAKGNAEWIWSQRIEKNDGCKFPSMEGGSNYNAHINARICSFFSRISRATAETKCAQYSASTFAWIVDNATASDGGYKWMTISRFPYYPVWFQEGVAGIGYNIAWAESEEELLSLPAGATNFLNGRDAETILLDIDVDSETPGNQQIVTPSPGETISVTATFQVWSSGGPGIIKQAFFIYSWTPSWPPSTAYYMPLYNGQPGYHPGVTQTTTFSLTVPEDEGNHYLWFCLGAHYSMELAVGEYETPLTLPAHAKIIVSAPPPVVPSYDIRLVFSAPSVAFGSEGENYYPVEGLYFDGDENIENNAENYREGFSDWRPRDLDDITEPLVDGDAASYVFIKEDGDFIVYEYWIYYAYNFKTKLPVLKDLENHEHDFEYIFVWADKSTNEVRRMSLNQHLWTNNYEFLTPPEFPVFIAVEQGGHGMIMLEPDRDNNGFPDDLNSDGMFDIRKPDNSPNVWPGMGDPTKIGVYTGGSFVAKLYPWKVYDGSVCTDGFGNDDLLQKGLDSEVLTPFFYNIPGDLVTDSFDFAISAYYNDVLLKAAEPQKIDIKVWTAKFYVRAPWKRSVFDNPNRQWSQISFQVWIGKELIRGLLVTIARGTTMVLTSGMKLGFVPPFVVGQLTSKILGFVIDPAEASVIDDHGNVLGYKNGELVSEIPGSLILFESELVDIYFILNATGDYSLGIAGEGNYNVTTVSAIDGETFSQTFSGEIAEGETHHYSISVDPTGQLRVISWEYIFEDTKRGTILKISADDRYFQFIAPDKAFGIKYDADMIILKRALITCYKDSEMRLITIGVDAEIDFCYAMAWDLHNRKCYLLIDKAGTE